MCAFVKMGETVTKPDVASTALVGNLQSPVPARTAHWGTKLIL